MKKGKVKPGDLIKWSPMYKTLAVDRGYYIAIFLRWIKLDERWADRDIWVLWEGKELQWTSMNCEVFNEST